MNNNIENPEKNNGFEKVNAEQLQEVNLTKAAALNESLQPMNLDIPMPSNVITPKPEAQEKKEK